MFYVRYRVIKPYETNFIATAIHKCSNVTNNLLHSNFSWYSFLLIHISRIEIIFLEAVKVRKRNANSIVDNLKCKCI